MKRKKSARAELFKRAMKGGYAWTKLRISEIDEEIEAKEILIKSARGNKHALVMPIWDSVLEQTKSEIKELKIRKDELENLYAPLNLLDPDDKQMILDVYVAECDPCNTAKAYGYSKSGMYNRLDAQLIKIL